MSLTFNDQQAAALLDALGLPTNTTDADTAVATVRDAVTASTAEGAQAAAVNAAARRIGLEVMDPDTANSLRAEAAEARQIKAAAARTRIENTVTDAVNRGKITPARRQHWINLITADPGMGDVLTAVPDETAVPMTEIGHGASRDDVQPGQPDVWFH